ncbi:O-antigen ligase family protein [Psychroserpens sp. MEBiC05023]
MLSVVVLAFHIIGSRLGFIGASAGLEFKVYGDNNAYILLSFLPLIYFNANLKIRRYLIIILICGVFLSLKRGAMVGLLVCLLGAYFFEKRTIRNKSLVEKLKRLFIVAASLTLLVFIYSKFADLFIERFEDFSGEESSFGSGRGNIYSLIWNDWFESNDMITYFIGKGYNSVQELTRLKTGSALMAHSDGLNFLHSYGLVGISLLLIFVIYQIKIVKRLFFIRSQLVIPYFMLFTIFFFKSIYSGNFETPNFIYLLIGFAVYNVLVDKLEIKK